MHEECARCGELKDLPDGYDVCEECAKVIGSADEYAELFAPQAYQDAKERVPDYIKKQRSRERWQ